MGAGNQTTTGEQGPQSPAVDPQRNMAGTVGLAYEVYSINDQGQRKRHQVWQDRTKAYAHLAQLKKLYGTDIKAGIREIKDMSGNLFSQSVKKCMSVLNKAAANQPPVAGKKLGIITGGVKGQVKTGKSPKISGHVSSKVQVGTTKSGKAIHNDPGHEAHESFSSADHLDAYRAHAKQLSHLDPKETNPSIIEHHKSALNTHYKMGVGGGMKKSFSAVVADCRRLLKAKSPGSVMGHTQSGKPIHENGNKGAKGWSAQDHMDAFHVHHEAGFNHRHAMANHPVFKQVREHEKSYYMTPEQTMARVSQYRGKPGADAVLHHEAMGDHHHGIADMHYQAAKKKGWRAPGK